MSTPHRAAALALALGIVLLAGLTGCSGGGDPGAAATEAPPEMSQAERKATLPDLEQEANSVAEGMVEVMAKGDLSTTGAEYVAAHPLGEHHHLGKWEIRERDVTGLVSGTVCIEYRQSDDADPVAMATTLAQYSPADGSVREHRETTPVGTGLNVGC
ncbi:hypothetical protein [Curtobacterium aetherium]|uniref:Uncharacterized protein n=1 Tax=Curtobacterium aetherium TaxID=2841594 RepID=A0ACD1E2N8_9MICO|nr:hypothetical protein [Curtobacterium sp. L6-1]QWS33175.1 hypothetical protein KM842_13125 [Curtobacterium sp. L6-1]